MTPIALAPVAEKPKPGPARTARRSAVPPRPPPVDDAALQAKIRQALAAEKRREQRLREARNQLAAAAKEFRAELEQLQAVRRAVEDKRRRLDELLTGVKVLEDDRNSARNARTSLEALTSYARGKKSPAS